jgi:hypothetical protein
MTCSKEGEVIQAETFSFTQGALDWLNGIPASGLDMLVLTA